MLDAAEVLTPMIKFLNSCLTVQDIVELAKELIASSDHMTKGEDCLISHWFSYPK